MNVILIQRNEIIEQSVVITDRRCEHLMKVIKPDVNDTLKIGIINGEIKRGKVISKSLNSITLKLDETSVLPAPKPLSLTLVMALARPKVFRRMIYNAAVLGIKDVWVIQTYRVDKSYWSSPLLHHNALQQTLLVGLEQAVDTQLPVINFRKRFKPFVEDELPQLLQGKKGYVGHPYNAEPCPEPSVESLLLCLGPEGGFIPYEIDKLKSQGLESIQLGPRILNVETALTVAVSRLVKM